MASQPAGGRLVQLGTAPVKRLRAGAEMLSDADVGPTAGKRWLFQSDNKCGQAVNNASVASPAAKAGVCRFTKRPRGLRYGTGPQLGHHREVGGGAPYSGSLPFFSSVRRTS